MNESSTSQHPAFARLTLYKKIYFLFLLLLCFNFLSAQVNFVIIDSIQILGNHKTKRNVILKEIDFHPGDTIDLSHLAKRMASNEKRIQSLGLFTLADVNIRNWNVELSTANVEIKVQENWFIYPYIIFELADRNFNVWRKEHNYSFDRVNYGLALNHINFTGNKDKLKLKYQQGYTKKYEIAYDFPYVKNKWGLSFNLFYSENRELPYLTFGNKLLFYKFDDERKILNQHRAGITLQNRTNAFIFQSLRMEYVSARVDDFVAKELNPDYFLEGSNKLKYLLLDYYWKNDHTLYPLYPMGGYKIEINVRKEGLGLYSQVNNTWIALSGERHTNILKNFILSNRLKLKVNLQDNKIPYFIYTAIGYRNDNITGYQLYVLDGKDFFIFKSSLKFKLFEKNLMIGNFMPSQFKIMDTKIFLRMNFDYGYTRDPFYGAYNPLTNTGIYGYGPAMDIILFNNFTLILELGISKSGEKGLFIESGLNF